MDRYSLEEPPGEEHEAEGRQQEGRHRARSRWSAYNGLFHAGWLDTVVFVAAP
jgi:hypothetical protein